MPGNLYAIKVNAIFIVFLFEFPLNGSRESFDQMQRMTFKLWTIKNVQVFCLLNFIDRHFIAGIYLLDSR